MNKDFYPNFNAPMGFQEILHDFAKGVLFYQPEDIIEFGADYFGSLDKGDSLGNDPKYIKILENIRERKRLELEKEQRLMMLRNESQNKPEARNKKTDEQKNKDLENTNLSDQSTLKDLMKSQDESSMRQVVQKTDNSFLPNTQRTVGQDDNSLEPRYFTSPIQETLKNETKDSQSLNYHSISTLDRSVATAPGGHSKDQKSQPILTSNDIQNGNKAMSAKVIKSKDDAVNFKSMQGRDENEDNATIPSNKFQKKNRNDEILMIEQREELKMIEAMKDEPQNDENNENATIAANQFEKGDKKDNETQKEGEGVLRINVMSLRWDGPPKDLRVNVELLNYSKSEKFQTQVMNKSSSPDWNSQNKMALTLTENYFKALKLKVILEDEGLFSSINIAHNIIDLAEIFENDDKWAMNNYIELTKSDQNQAMSPPMLYLQIRWLWNSKNYPDADALPKDINDVEKTIVQNLFEEEKIQGLVHVNVLEARNLQGTNQMDCDSFCEVCLNYDKKSYNRTKTINQDRNAKWNASFNLPIQNLKVSEKDNSKLLFKVLNSDITGDEFLGGSQVFLKELIEKPGNWFNGWVTLSNEQCGKSECGQIYIQAVYFKEPQTNPILAPPMMN